MGCQGGRGSLSCALGALLLVRPRPGVAGGREHRSSSTTCRSASPGSATFTITRDAGLLSGATSVAFQTVDGSAGSADYAAAAGR